MHKLFNTAFYIASENLAFSKFKGLCDLQEKNGLDFGSQYKNDKACRDFVENIAAVEKERSQEEIENARFLCVLADGSTDKIITEQESVYVRCTGSNGRSSTHFADLVPVTSADAPGVTAAIQKGLQTLSIDESVLKKKLACCNFDGASVMMGKKWCCKTASRYSPASSLHHTLCGTQSGVGCARCNKANALFGHI